MGQKANGEGASPSRLTKEAAIAVASEPADSRQTEVVLDVLAGAPTVVLQQLTRAQHADLPITEDSDPKDDEAWLVAAAVVDPVMDAEEWKAVLAGWPVGAVMQLMGAVAEHNGLNAGAVRRAAQTFRS